MVSFGPQYRPERLFAGSIAVSALNPKSIIFFVAFVPQFITADSSYLVQCLILIATFATVVAATDTLYALLALRVVYCNPPRWRCGFAEQVASCSSPPVSSPR